VPLPNLEEFCRSVDAIPTDLCVVLPGGAEICAALSTLPPSLYEHARSLLAQASGALAPLTPIFDIIEAIVAIKDCVTAIPDALGPPPDPSKLTDCVPELVRRIEKLLSLLPPASVLLMIVQLLDVLIAIFDGMISELQSVVRLLNRIAAAKLVAGNVPQLLAPINCGEQSAATTMDNLSRAIASIRAVIELVNLFCDLAGLRHVPEIGSEVPGDPGAAIDHIAALIDPLRDFRDSIPV